MRRRIIDILVLVVLGAASPGWAQPYSLGVRVNGVSRIARLTFIPITQPASPQEGDVYQSTTDHNFYIYNGTTWIAVAAVANPTFTGQWTVNGSLCAAGQVVQGGSPTTCTAKPTITSISSTATVYLENTLFTNTKGCPNCGFPVNAYSRINAYDNTAGGLQIGSMANDYTLPAMRFVAIGGQWTGIANPVVAPIMQFSVASGNAGGGVLGSNGYLVEFTNATSGAPDLFRWCRTTEAAIASCTTDYGGGNPDRYLFDFAQSASDLFRVARLSFGASKTTASAPADGQLNILNQAETAGVGFDVATDAVWKLRVRAQNAYATADALAYRASGTAITSGTTLLSNGSGMAVANVGANSCGTSAASIAGNNNAFVITVGATSGSQCRVAFTVTAATEWDCTVTDSTTTIATRATPVDTTHTDFFGAFVAADKVTGVCFPR